jgi:uncharacterized YigZ family protein
MIKEYRTIKGGATYELEVKRSRFIASIKPVNTEEEARRFIDEIRARFRDAAHNVYAYDISNETVIQRYSDDGEPQGTAGIPVMESIKRNELKNVVIVVTRYFGGILLGASGLVRAYGNCASACIEAAGIIKRVLCVLYSITLDYRYLGKMQAEMANKGILISDIQYADNVIMDVAIETDRESILVNIVNEVSSGNVVMRRRGQVFIDQEL